MYRSINIWLVVLVLILCNSFLVTAATPSPAMMAQFNKLPHSEQIKLAKKYGLTAAGNEQSMNEPISGREDYLDSSTPDLDEMLEDKELSKEDKSAPKRFGLSMFESQSKPTIQADNMPVPDFYILGPNDQLQIQIFGKVAMDEELVIARDGTIAIPEVGTLTVAGLTFQNAVKLITERVQSSIIGVDVAVSMGKMRSIAVLVAGESKQPGTYTVPALTTVTQMLSVAGGITDIGSLRNITIQRSNGRTSDFDLYDLLLRGDSRQDLNLQNGDVVFIPPYSALVEVKGEVLRPALYEVKNVDTLNSLLQMAGGGKAQAFLKDASIARIARDGSRQLLNVDLTSNEWLKIEIKNGDVLTVGKVSARTEKQVALVGTVVRPGIYAYRSGMRVNDVVNSLWNDVKVNADLDYAIIVSRDANTNRLSIRQFHLGQAINEPGSEHNLTLKPQDTIYVFPFSADLNRTELDKELYRRYSDSILSKRQKSSMANDSNATSNAAKAKLSAVEQNFSANAFKALLYSDKISELGNSDGSLLVPEIDRTYIVELMRVFLDEMTREQEFMNYSSLLSRRELLYPLTEELGRQLSVNGQMALVSVSGEVRYPGDYPLVENNTVSNMIAAAGGLLPSAFLENAELTRSFVSAQGSVSIEHKKINLGAELSHSQVTKVASRDRLNVFKFSDWGTENRIQVTGQVRFPGNFAVRNGETLSDVLKRAGGLSANAFPQGAVFVRRQVKTQEGQQLRLLTQQLRKDIAARTLSSESSSVSVQDSLAMLNEIEKTQPAGRIVVDIASILEGKEDYNFPVEDGDELLIPLKKTYISVIGEVQHPSSHRIITGLLFDDYLRLAGGPRKRADVERVYIIRADGSVYIPKINSWFSVNESQIHPGDTIVVPLDTEFKDSLSLWTQVTQILYQSVVALAAIKTF